VALTLLVHHVVESARWNVPLGVSPYSLLHESLQGALAGALFGAMIGGAVGLVGHRLGGRIGWCLAGAYGGLGIVGGILVFLSSHCDPYREVLLLPPPYATIATWGFGYLLTGGLLGLAIGSAVQSGRSRVPGVQYVAQVITEVNPPVPPTEASQPAAEVIPAAAPEGRGDEPSPSALPSAGSGGGVCNGPPV
jgi:hypothetical protein